MADFCEYKVNDVVQVIESGSCYEDMIGVVRKTETEKKLCEVELADAERKEFHYNQIMLHRPEEALRSLIDLALDLGEPAREMFELWAAELYYRFTRHNK